ncbi:MAG: peptidase dimerization domain-containing protein [Ferruginibacter sp.]
MDLREGGHHSGNWGGLIADPGFLLAHALASIVGPTGALLVEELKAPPMTASVKAALSDVEIDGGDKGPQIDRWWGEPGLSPAERVYAANTFNILTFWTGTPGRPVNAIPPKAVANCQLRFIAGTDVDNIVPALKRHLEAKGHHLVKVMPPPAVNDGAFPATRIEPDHPWAAFVTASVQRS